MMAIIRRLWWIGLTGIVALYYLVIAFTAGGAIGIVAILGALLLGVAMALLTYSRLTAAMILVIGALPLGILTWWSLITPMVAVLALICGGLAIGTRGQDLWSEAPWFRPTEGQRGAYMTRGEEQ